MPTSTSVIFLISSRLYKACSSLVVSISETVGLGYEQWAPGAPLTCAFRMAVSQLMSYPWLWWLTSQRILMRSLPGTPPSVFSGLHFLRSKPAHQAGSFQLMQISFFLLRGRLFSLTRLFVIERLWQHEPYCIYKHHVFPWSGCSFCQTAHREGTFLVGSALVFIMLISGTGEMHACSALTSTE